MPKRTYILDDELVKKFEQLVPPDKRDEWINEAIAQSLEKERVAEPSKYPKEDVDDEDWPEPEIVWPNGLKAEREKHHDTLPNS